jgi:hypothetical protein
MENFIIQLFIAFEQKKKASKPILHFTPFHYSPSRASPKRLHKGEGEKVGMRVI